ncbi:unnamed protein product [Mytilus edulis]|uniref:Uncharacterized protein n=1 Tax=Mytilus edulis TaxID=6550 RepID=A0A8S3QYD9_MYTED|nr:unnamed protein product [Mytilus edulis]
MERCDFISTKDRNILPSSTTIRKVIVPSSIACGSVCSAERTCCYASFDRKTKQCSLDQSCPQISLSCQIGWIQYETKCYFFSDSERTWNDAKIICENKDGMLAEVKSSCEKDFLKTTATAFALSFWLGGTDIQNEGDWIWASSQTVLTFDDWTVDAPNNRFGNEHCLAIRKLNGFQWNDDDCSSSFRFICEKICYQHRYRTEQNQTRYDTGCTYPDLCTKRHATGIIFGKRSSQHSHIVCESCCNETLLCNRNTMCNTLTVEKTINATCVSTNECKGNLICSSHRCQCPTEDYYWKDPKCYSKKKYNDQCNSSDECSASLYCDHDKCHCSNTTHWNGTFCIQMTPCSSSPCLNNGVCYVVNSDFICVCPKGYSDIRCQVTPCDKIVCLYGGRCSSANGTVACNCRSGFSGTVCQVSYFKTIYSSGYPSAYVNGVHQSWTLYAGIGNTIRIKFRDFHTEKCCDHVRVHDGRYTNNDTIADYTGSLSGIKVNNSTGQYMLLDFKADGSNVDVGFRADVYKVKI